MKGKSLVLILAVILWSCSNLEVSLERQIAVTINEPREDLIGATAARLSAEIIDSGTGIDEYGFCYSHTHGAPDISDRKVLLTSPIEETYSEVISGLTPNTDYHVCAYVMNGNETAYSRVVYFRTKKLPAEFVVYTGPISIYNDQIELSGSVDISRGKVVQFGHIWKKHDPDNLNINNWDGRYVFNQEITSDRMFTSFITSPEPGVSYFVKSFATDGNTYKYGITRQINYTVSSQNN